MKLESFKKLKVGDKIKYQESNGVSAASTIKCMPGMSEYLETEEGQYVCRRQIISRIVKKKKVKLTDYLEYDPLESAMNRMFREIEEQVYTNLVFPELDKLKKENARLEGELKSARSASYYFTEREKLLVENQELKEQLKKYEGLKWYGIGLKCDQLFNVVASLKEATHEVWIKPRDKSGGAE